MIPPACNLAVTFTAWRGGGGVEPAECQGQGQLATGDIVRENSGGMGVFGGRQRGIKECGRKWAGGLKKLERSGGKRAQMREGKIRGERRRADRSRGGCGLLKGRYGLSRLTGGGSGGCCFFTDFGRLLGKVETTGAAPWPLNKRQKKHTLETRRVCMRTPTHSFHLLWFRQPSCWFLFLQWMLLSPRFVPQSLNEGQYVRKKEFTQTPCSAAQRNIKEPSSLSYPRSHEDAEQGISTSKWKTGSGVKYHETNQSASCQKWISSLIKIQISGDVLLSVQGGDQQGSCWTHGSHHHHHHHYLHAHYIHRGS